MMFLHFCEFIFHFFEISLKMCFDPSSLFIFDEILCSSKFLVEHYLDDVLEGRGGYPYLNSVFYLFINQRKLHLPEFCFGKTDIHCGLQGSYTLIWKLNNLIDYATEATSHGTEATLFLRRHLLDWTVHYFWDDTWWTGRAWWRRSCTWLAALSTSPSRS